MQDTVGLRGTLVFLRGGGRREKILQWVGGSIHDTFPEPQIPIVNNLLVTFCASLLDSSGLLFVATVAIATVSTMLLVLLSK